jgi:hypothetical protein
MALEGATELPLQLGDGSLLDLIDSSPADSLFLGECDGTYFGLAAQAITADDQLPLVGRQRLDHFPHDLELFLSFEHHLGPLGG